MSKDSDPVNDSSQPGAGASRRRVVVVEDNFHHREALLGRLRTQADIEIVGAHALAGTALEALARERPHIVLVDLALPDFSGIELIRRIMALHPQITCIAVTTFDDEAHIVQAIGAGASGYVLKEDFGQQLINTLRSICNDEPPISPGIARRMLEVLRRAAPDGNTNIPASVPGEGPEQAGSRPHSSVSPASTVLYLEPLTDRERVVLQCIAQGQSLVSIARHSGRSYHTIRTQVKSVYRKLNAHTLQEAIHLARRTGQLAD